MKETKINPDTMHFLPFVPSRKRQKGFYLKRTYGKKSMEITASETLNTYDLMTLLFMTREYVANGYIAGHFDDEEIAGIKISTNKFLHDLGISTNKNNKVTLKKSLLRLKSIDIVFSTEEEEIYTNYIYMVKFSKKLDEFIIYANLDFIEMVVNGGMLVNLERLTGYESKDQYSILLDLYLQGTKTVGKIKNKKTLRYREKYTNRDIENALKLDCTNLANDKKRKKIAEVFKQLNEKGLPKYTYEKYADCWYRKDIDRHSMVK